jgi:Mg2+-importing ATPase
MTDASAISVAARQSPDEVLSGLGAAASGLSASEAAGRLVTGGPNAFRTHRASAWSVLARQFKSPILALLIVTAVASLVVGLSTKSIVIGVMRLVSNGLGFVNL